MREHSFNKQILFLLDEPFVGIDITSEEIIVKLLKSYLKKVKQL